MTTAETTFDRLLLEANSAAQPPRRLPTVRGLLSTTLLGLTTLLGVAAFLYPFWMPALAGVGSAGREAAHAADAPLVLVGIVLLCFAVLLVEVQAQAVSTKAIALLGVLVALNSVLRFAEVAIPGPGGFSPIFLLIITGGYIFGARIGFLLGALTMVASALITGGVGPWLPYQMLTAGWVGMTAPLCRPLVRAAAGLLGRLAPGVARAAPHLAEVSVLALFGAIWGLLFGLIMNIWFWPYAMGPSAMSWDAGEGFASALRSYALFYAVTSLVWDLLRAAGNVLFLALVGAAVLRILRRFQQRFDFAYQPLPSPVATGRGEPVAAPQMLAGPLPLLHAATGSPVSPSGRER
jgi:energy-coupling factor transport system substrate-specific component